MVNKEGKFCVFEKEDGIAKDVASQIYSDLLEHIKKGTYPPGSRLPSENEMREMYGVSRNTIRLAINRLKTQGIVETRRGDGSYVRLGETDYFLQMAVPVLAQQEYGLLSILEFRRGIEVESARLAAERATADDLRSLQKCLRDMRMSRNDMAVFSKADAAMHAQLTAASHNELFVSIMAVLQRILTNDMEALLVHQGSDIDSYFYHEAIISCIENKKPEEAAFLMNKHLNSIIARIQSWEAENKTADNEDAP